MPNVSVIIPTWNEESVIGRTLEHLGTMRPLEVIVSDGGSTDTTVALTERFPRVRVVRSPKGRARQLNAGAATAHGDILLFLHADTQLPENAIELITRSMTGGAIGGRFRVRFDIPSLRYRLLAFYTRYPFFSYGDQAFFVSREGFHELRGFDITAPFEDVDFFRRLRRKGRTHILEASVITSARRFRHLGFFKQKMINLFLSFLPYVGISPKPLMRRWYPDVR